MFIPPSHRQQELLSSEEYTDLQLVSGHLYIPADIANQIFQNVQNVNVVYYADKRRLLIAPKEDELFSKMHKAKQFMLKKRNALGSRSIALREIFIDHEVDNSDRTLIYEVVPEMNMLNIVL